MDTIHILQKTYEQLYVARIPLLKYLSERLQAVSRNWEEDCVDRVLDNPERKDFSDLDIYYLIRIFLDSQNKRQILTVFPDDKDIYKGNMDLFRFIKNLRCDVMHPSFESYTYETFQEWTESIEKFIHIFDPTKSLEDYTKEIHQKEKDKLLNIIKTKVINPALKSQNLSKKTKKNIQNTLDRLEVQDSAEGIIAFYEDALKSNQGQMIGVELEANKLKSFEKIAPMIFKEYYS